MYIDFVDDQGNVQTVRVDDRDIICFSGNIVFVKTTHGPINNFVPAVFFILI